jgi:hypothetical protein
MRSSPILFFQPEVESRGVVPIKRHSGALNGGEVAIELDTLMVVRD